MKATGVQRMRRKALFKYGNEWRESPTKMVEASEAFCKACLETKHAKHLATFLDLNRRVIYCRCELCIRRPPDCGAS
jgi:hypothetical protein